MEKEMLTEKEKKWLEKMIKAQKFSLGLAIFCFISGVLDLLVYFKTNSYYIKNFAENATIIVFTVGSSIMAMRHNDNRFLRIIDKLK